MKIPLGPPIDSREFVDEPDLEEVCPELGAIFRVIGSELRQEPPLRIGQGWPLHESMHLPLRSARKCAASRRTATFDIRALFTLRARTIGAFLTVGRGPIVPR
jgi:hypothetical protein